MENQRFDEIARSLANPTSRRGLLRGVIATALGGALGMTGAVRGVAQADKVRICHLTGNGGYVQIEVSRDALSAHAGHGDLIDDSSCPVGESLDYATCTCGGTTSCEPDADADTCAGQCGAIANNCGQVVECEPCCTPVATCPPGRCGALDDGCGGTIDCGCTDRDVCIDTTCCAPISMCPEGRCGHIDDGCGGTIKCKCPIGDVCTGTTCCTPISTCPPGRCGAIDDGCGGTLKCKCSNGDVCNGTTCCTPISTCPPGRCGTVGDGCGGTLECGCPTGQTCTGTTCCAPDPDSVTCAGQCGAVINNCGQTVDCGSCCSPITTCPAGSCGPVDDGCGGTIQCDCPTGDVCTGTTCCTPKPVDEICAGLRDITLIDNCGQTVKCPSSCIPITCRSDWCGTHEDGCGGTIDCLPCGVGCFVSGTLVALSNGTSKPIAQVVEGDAVFGRGGRVNTVLGVITHELGDQPLHAFNGGATFVSASHPFLTDEGWKAIDPDAARAEVPGLPIGQLAAGDVLIAADGASVPLLAVQRRSADPATPIFDLDVDGDNTYVADGWVVHNKLL